MKIQKDAKKTTKNKKNSRRAKKPAEKEMLCRFVALPRVLRQEEFGFKNLTDFAKKYEVDKATLSLWLREDEVKDKIRENWKEWGRDRTPNVILALYRTAVKEGRASEVKAWMQIIEEIEEKATVLHRGVVELVEKLDKENE